MEWIAQPEIWISLCEVSGPAVVDCGEGNTINANTQDPEDCDGDYDNNGLNDGWVVRHLDNLNEITTQ